MKSLLFFCGEVLYKNTIKLKHGNKEYLHCKGKGDLNYGDIFNNKTIGTFKKYIVKNIYIISVLINMW